MLYKITASKNGTRILQDINSGKYFKGPTLTSWSFDKSDAIKLDEGRANKVMKHLKKLDIECKTFYSI